MCALKILLLFLVVTIETYLFQVVASGVEEIWVWTWNLGTAFLGWQLLKQRFKGTGGRVARQLDGRYRVPLFLLLPGLLTDSLALGLIVIGYGRSKRYQRRQRASSLWVGEPDEHGVIDVQAIRLDTPKTPSD